MTPTSLRAPATAAAATSPMKHLVLASLVIAVCATAASMPRTPQDPAYHHFADQRRIAGIPNAFDVLSNLPFLFAGAAGLLTILENKVTSTRHEATRSWLTFFGAAAATTAGSMYYHLLPNNARLVWDRIPIALAFASLLNAVIAERVDARTGPVLLAPLLAGATGSVLYWYWSELAGHGDLRPYLCVQFGFSAILVGILLLYREPRADTPFLVAGIAAYALAKICEAADPQIYSATHVVSGHSLKHLASAAGVACIVAMLRARRALPARAE